jgi:hypothetical protein
MKIKFFLWLTVIIFCFHLGGHLFDMIANQPNWKSGEIADVSRLRDFYAQSSPKNFFIYLVMGGPIINLFSFILVWNIGNRTKWFFGLSFIISVIIAIFTVGFFVPINEYIFNTINYDPIKLKELVFKWIAMENLRVVIIALGTLSSILGVNAYTKIKSSVK